MISDEVKLRKCRRQGADDSGQKQVEARGEYREYGTNGGVSKHTIYAWKPRYGGMDVSKAQEAKPLRERSALEEDGRRPQPGQRQRPLPPLRCG